MSETSPPEPQTSSTGDSPAKTYQWPVAGRVLGASAALSGLSSRASLAQYGPDGALSRQFPAFSPQAGDVTSDAYSMIWTNSGTASHGQLWTLNFSESRSSADASLLWQAIMDQAPPRYSLSPTAAVFILQRAAHRERDLPLPLKQALETLARTAEAPGMARTLPLPSNQLAGGQMTMMLKADTS